MTGGQQKQRPRREAGGDVRFGRLDGILVDSKGVGEGVWDELTLDRIKTDADTCGALKNVLAHLGLGRNMMLALSKLKTTPSDTQALPALAHEE